MRRHRRRRNRFRHDHRRWKQRFEWVERFKGLERSVFHGVAGDLDPPVGEHPDGHRHQVSTIGQLHRHPQHVVADRAVDVVVLAVDVGCDRAADRDVARARRDRHEEASGHDQAEQLVETRPGTDRDGARLPVEYGIGCTPEEPEHEPASYRPREPRRATHLTPVDLRVQRVERDERIAREAQGQERDDRSAPVATNALVPAKSEALSRRPSSTSPVMGTSTRPSRESDA